MRSPSKQEQESGDDRRKSERRRVSAKPVESGTQERREVEQRGVGTAMVDALEDILRWERASERAIKVATSSTTSLDNASSSN